MRTGTDELARFLASLQDEGKAAWTVDKYRMALRRFVERAEASPGGLQAVTPEWVQTYLRRFTGRNTRRWHLVVIRQFCRHLVARGVLATDPTAGVKAPREQEKAPNVITAAEWEALVREASRRAKSKTEVLALLSLLRFSGLRVHEAVGYRGRWVWDAHQQQSVREDRPGLRRGDVHLDALVVMVRGKGGRVAPALLTETTAGFVRALMARAKDQRPEAPIFQTRAGGPRGTKWASGRLRVLAKAAGLRHLTPHMLRHTFATGLLENGVNLRAVQRLMRHQDMASTLTYADYVTPEALRREYEKGVKT